MDIDETRKNLLSYIDKSFDELRQSLGSPTTGSTIGISFIPDFVVDHMPDSEEVRPGMYIDHIETLSVEVLEHDAKNNMVTMAVHVNGDEMGSRKLQVISGFLFHHLFRPAVIDPLA